MKVFTFLLIIHFAYNCKAQSIALDSILNRKEWKPTRINWENPIDENATYYFIISSKKKSGATGILEKRAAIGKQKCDWAFQIHDNIPHLIIYHEPDPTQYLYTAESRRKSNKNKLYFFKGQTAGLGNERLTLQKIAH